MKNTTRFVEVQANNAAKSQLPLYCAVRYRRKHIKASARGAQRCLFLDLDRELAGSSNVKPDRSSQSAPINTLVPCASTAGTDAAMKCLKAKSWGCATGKSSIKLDSCMAERTALPSVSIGYSAKDRQSRIKKSPPFQPLDNLPNLYGVWKGSVLRKVIVNIWKSHTIISASIIIQNWMNQRRKW